MLVIVACLVVNKDLLFVAVHFVAFVVVPVARIHRTVVGIHRTRCPVVLLSCCPVVLSSSRSHSPFAYLAHNSTFNISAFLRAAAVFLGNMLDWDWGREITGGWLYLTGSENFIDASPEVHGLSTYLHKFR